MAGNPFSRVSDYVIRRETRYFTVQAAELAVSPFDIVAGCPQN